MPNKNLNKSSLPSVEKILIIGSGGRENSLAWALRKSNGVKEVWVAPGNGGTLDHPGCKPISIQETDTEQLIIFGLEQKIDLIVIGPEAPLAAGLADQLREAGLAVFGPGAEGAKLEASKDWAKKLMHTSSIPTAKYWSVSNKNEALSILKQEDTPLVVKADGLAAGKGVTVPATIEEAIQAINNIFDGKFGSSSTKVILEEKLEGPEVSIFALCDGKKYILLPPAQDHKRLKDGDKGPNTGGMGAYTPAQLLNDKDLHNISKSIIEPTLEGLTKLKIDYRGVIYAGLMVTSNGPKVIEFNCRFGDPECQALMPLMGPELSGVLMACALGCLEIAPQLTISKACSACVVASAEGYPESPRSNDLIEIHTKEKNFLQIFHAGTKRNQDGTLYTAGGRVLSVVAQGKNFDEAFNSVYRGIQEISFKGIQYRKDIGYQVRTF